jgi:hypothetical protein
MVCCPNPAILARRQYAREICFKHILEAGAALTRGSVKYFSGQATAIQIGSREKLPLIFMAVYI